MAISIELNTREHAFLISTFGRDTHPFDQITAGMNILNEDQVYEVSEKLLAISDTEFGSNWERTDRGHLIDGLVDKFEIK